MPLWTFCCYVTGTGRKVIDEWYEELSPKAQAAFDVNLDYLRARPVHEWKRPYFDNLGEECSGLGEIRFKADRVQHRPLGYFGPDRLKFTILFPAVEKGDKFVPRDACRQALDRKTAVETGAASAVECFDE